MRTKIYKQIQKNKKTLLCISLFTTLQILTENSFGAKYTLGVNINNTSPALTGTSESVDTISKGSSQAGGGLLFQFSTKRFSQIELGAILLNRNFKIQSGANEFDVKMPILHMPYLIKKVFGKGKMKFEVGGGGYYNIVNSAITETNTATKISATYQPGEWITLKSEYGVEFDLGMAFPLKSSQILLDIRYAMGIKDLSQYSTQTWKFSDMYILLGWRLGK